MTNQNHNVLYTGMTNNLIRRAYEHKNSLVAGFTKKYYVHKLVYFDFASDVNSVIAREKQIKGWSRKKKIELINSITPEWLDLYDRLLHTRDSSPCSE